MSEVVQVALESHQGFIFACEGDPGIGQTTWACASVKLLFSCACVTPVLRTRPPKKSVISFFCKIFCRLLTFPAKILRRKTCNMKKFGNFTIKTAVHSKDGKAAVWWNLVSRLCFAFQAVVLSPLQAYAYKLQVTFPAAAIHACLSSEKSTVFSVNMSPQRARALQELAAGW